MLIAQISDSHITLDAPHRDGRLADLRRCVADINALDPAPDLVIHSGDVAHDGRPREYALAREALDKLRAPYCVLPGNRDGREALRAAFADRMPGVGEAPFLQYSLRLGGVRLVVLDTLSGSGPKGDLCERRLRHLEELLSHGSDGPVLLVMHHPPHEVNEIPEPFQFEDAQAVARLAEILARGPRVLRILCGHVHRNTSGTFAGIPASTVTCMALDLRKGAYPPEAEGRPIYQLHSFDPAGGFTTKLRMAPAAVFASGQPHAGL